jgi:hypothetical protein
MQPPHPTPATSPGTSAETHDTVTVWSFPKYYPIQFMRGTCLSFLNELFFQNYFYRALLEGESNPEILIWTEHVENMPQGKY